MNAATCPDHDALEAYLLGKFDDDAIDAHLDECADCRSALDEMDAAVNEPFACLRQPAAPPPDWQPPYQLIAKAERLLEGSTEPERPGSTNREACRINSAIICCSNSWPRAAWGRSSKRSTCI